MNNSIRIDDPRAMRAQRLWLAIVSATSFALSPLAQAALDLNGDGMSDFWQARFGAVSLSANGDEDGDGVTNVEESRLSSNPFDPDSYFGLRSYEVDDAEGRIDLTFHTAPGNVYQIQSSVDLSDTSWIVEREIVGVDDRLITVGRFFDRDAVPALFYRIHLLADRDEDGDGLDAREEGLLGLDDTDANSNGERAGGDMAWVVDRLYSSESLELTDGTMLAGSPPSMMEVSRFLNQATFGPTYEEIEAMALSGMSFGEWIDEQISMEPTTIVDSMQEELDRGAIREQFLFRKGWWRAAMTGDDQLRQRVAFALSEILVVSGQGSDVIRGDFDAAATYYDLLVNGAFADYADLLEDVTFNYGMGDFLGHVRNQPENPELGVFPDENYAREVMQLFSIGLWELNRDGSRKIDGSGKSIHTYTNFHVRVMAKVLTGFNFGGTLSFFHYIYNTTIPMSMWPDYHDQGEKFLVNGGYLPPGQTPEKDVRDALDNLANHPNTGTFIGRQLIQRLVTSNPSPEYLHRVANAYYDNGFGRSRDMGAVIRAILLDPEARSSAGLDDPEHGKVREPYISFVQAARAFESSNQAGSYPMVTLLGSSQLGQNPLGSPTVFNFFLPDHQPSGLLASAGLFAPEFQILTPSLFAEWANVMERCISEGFDPFYLAPPLLLKQDYSAEMALVDNTTALIDRLDLMLTYGALTDETREILRASMEDYLISDEQKLAVAIYLLMTSPEYVVLR